MSDARIDLTWDPPGPVAGRFMAAQPAMGGTLLLNGPIGSGKTTADFLKGIKLSGLQRPSTLYTRPHPRDGRPMPVRKFKLTTVRDTYRQLWKTTLPSWWKRVPREAGTWSGSENGPASHHIEFVLPDSIIDFHADFIAIGENAVEDVMRGYEPTWWYLNEMDLLAREVYNYARGRAGRYPDMSEGGPTTYGILADCNAPEFEGWLYQDIFTKSPAELVAIGVQLFIQPGGRDPGAENLKNLPPGYYANQLAGQPEWYVARMVDNKPGYSRAGKPVHPEFRDALHVPAHELDPIPGVGLVIGIDPRTNPSAVFLQRLPSGQRRFIDELQGEQNMGPRRFGKLLAEFIHDRFGFLRPQAIRGMCDPSARYGADKEAGEQDWLEIVSAVTGVRIDPAPSNNLDVRREALKKPLMELIDGEPAILVSPRCKVLRAGLNSGFRYRKLNVPGADRWADEVEKNHYADLCEAAEYACLSDGADLEIRERKAADVDRLRQMSAQGQHDWDPLA